MAIFDVTDLIYHHNHDGETPIIEFKLSDLISEDRMISNMNEPDNAVISVYSGEGDAYPHFHYKTNKIDACIMIFENRYFSHGSHKGTIEDGKTRKKPDKWLLSTCVNKDEPDNLLKVNGLPIWSAMVKYWNYCYNTKYDSDISNKPDYRTIEPYKRRR